MECMRINGFLPLIPKIVPPNNNHTTFLKKIHFIINGLSVHAKNTQKEIRKAFENKAYFIAIKISQYKGHAVEQTSKSISEGADIIVACGGDGTINEVARVLVKTSIPLGILPIGSGNGLARHLCIPLELSAALECFKQFRAKRIDVGQANNHYFLSNISVAFSALVIHCYDKERHHGFTAYSRAFLKAISKFSYSSFEILEGKNSSKSNPFILIISNTNQLGYNKTLTPNADIFDGKLDMLCVERNNPFFLFSFMCFAFFGQFPRFFKSNRRQIEEIKLLSIGPVLKFQVDGEKLELATEILHVKILPKSLEVIC